MKKAIEIEEMRISSNGEHLEFIINCPADYQFTEFTIQVGDEDDEYSVADSLFYDIEYDENDNEISRTYIINEDNRFIGQVPVSLFGVSGPEIYRIHLEAEHTRDCMPEDYLTPDYTISEDGHILNKYGYPVLEEDCYDLYEGAYVENGIAYDEDGEPIENMGIYHFITNDGEVVVSDTPKFIYTDCIEHLTESCDKPDEIIYADIWISDVSHVYHCLMDDIVALQAKCLDKEAQDRVIRNYLTLYAHQEALRLGYIDEATKWFNAMSNCFNGPCGKPKRNVNIGCGCRAQTPHHHGHNCGCHR